MGTIGKVIGKLEPFQRICAVAFLIFAIISCVATAQSLTLTLGLDTLPQWLVFTVLFVLAFLLFLLTSYCFKLIIDSLNSNVDMARSERHKNFGLGLLGVLLFWLVCSMPTNTHSLLYTKVHKEVVTNELDNQKQVYERFYKSTGQDIDKEYQDTLSAFRDKISTLKQSFMNEVEHSDRLGLGDKAKKILRTIEQACGKQFEEYFNDETNPRPMKDHSDAEIKRVQKHFDKRIDRIKNVHEETLKAQWERAKALLDDDKNNLKNRVERISEMLKAINDDTYKMKDARLLIEEGYNQNVYRNAILDNVETLEDPSKGHIDNNVKYYQKYKISRLHSVFKVWGDFFSKRFQNLDFDMLYWIIISLIIDIAGLAFYGIAFRRKE